MPESGPRRLAPALAVLLVALLAGLSLGSGVLIARHLRADATAVSRLFIGVIAGLNDPEPGAAEEALLRLGEQVRGLGIPIVVTDGTGRVTAAANTPLADLPLDDPRLHAYAAELDRQNPPIVEPAIGTIHYGVLPVGRLLTALAVLQALTLAVMVGVAVFVYRTGMSAQRDRLWVAMAREAAHQLGTPLTSLQGWIEALRSRPSPPPGLADHLAADAERLDRVAQRFERIGNPARRDVIGLGALADRVAGYFRPRLPRHANPIEMRVVRTRVFPEPAPARTRIGPSTCSTASRWPGFRLRVQSCSSVRSISIMPSGRSMERGEESSRRGRSAPASVPRRAYPERRGARAPGRCPSRRASS